MGRTLRRVTLLFVAASMVLSQGGKALAVPDPGRADRAVRYMASQQSPDGSINAFSPIGSTSDAILAIVAAGTGHSAMMKALRFIHAQAVA